MSDITDYSKNYAGAARGAKYDSLEVTTLTATTQTATTGNITTVNATTVDSTNIDGEVYKVAGTTIKMPVLSGEYTTTGGAATESATITGVQVGDIVVASLKSGGTGTVTLLTATENTADTVDFTFSANPLADTVVSYLILR